MNNYFVVVEVDTNKSFFISDEHELVNLMENINIKKNTNNIDIDIDNISNDDEMILVDEYFELVSITTIDDGIFVKIKNNMNSYFVGRLISGDIDKLNIGTVYIDGYLNTSHNKYEIYIFF